MGQGAAGDLSDLSICTCTLYTCPAIKMYNATKGCGGLSHCPEGALGPDASAAP